MYKSKKRTYGDNVYTNFRCLNMPDDDLYLFYLFNHAYQVVGKQITDDISDNPFETDED